MGDYNLGTARGKIELDASGATKGAAQANAATDSVTKKWAGASRGLVTVGAGMTAAAGAVAVGFGLAINKAADFEKQISAIGAVSGANSKELQALRDKALQLGKDTAFSASESAQAMEELVKAGIPLEDVLNGAADAAVALAAAGSVDMPEAATQISNAMNQFHIAAKDVASVADTIAGAANASAIDVGDFGMSLKQVGAVANLAGLSFEDTAVAIAEMGQAGIKGSDAGTSLKTMLNNLIPVTDKQIALSKELGLITKDGSNAFFDQEGKVKSLDKIQATLAKSLKGMSKEQKLAALQTLFGSDAIRAAAVLADNGAAGYDKMATAMGKVSAADVAAKRMDNLNGKMEQLKGSVETAAIVIGSALIPVLTKIVDAVTLVVNKFLELSPGMQKAIIAFIGITAAIVGFVGIVATIAGAIGLALAALAPLAAAIGITAGALLGIVAIIPLVIAAVVALAIIIYKNWDAIKAKSLEIWGSIVAFLSGIWNAIKGAAAAAWGAIVSAVMVPVNAIKNFVIAQLNILKAIWSALWNTFGPLVKAVWDLIVAVIKLAFYIIYGLVKVQLMAIKAVFTTVWNAIKAVTSAVWNAIKSVVTTIAGAIKASIQAQFNAAKAIVVAIFNAINNAIGDKLRAAYNTVKTIVGNIRDFFSGAIGWLTSAGKDIIQGLINGIVSMGATLLGKVTDMVNSVTEKVKSVFKIGSPSKVMIELGKFIGEGLAIGVTQSAKDVQASAQDLAEKLHAALEEKLKKQQISKTVSDHLVKFVNTQKRNLVQLAKDRDTVTARLVEGKKKLEDALTVRSDAAKSVADSAKSFASITSIVGQVLEAGGNAPVTATDLIQGLKDRLLALSNYRDGLHSLIAQGLNKTTYAQLLNAGADGGGAYVSALVQAGSGAITAVNTIQGDIDTAAAALGSESSHTMYDAGVSAAQGMVDGLKSQQGALTEQMTILARKLIRALRKELDMHSPSRKLYKEMSLAMQGAVNAVDDGVAQVANAMSTVNTAIPKLEVPVVATPSLSWAQQQAATAANGQNGGPGAGDGGPLIGTQNVWYPQAEPASQAAARQRTTGAQLGRVG